MNSQQLFERLKQKTAYEKFILDNPDSKLYAIFCMFSAEEKEGDKIQFDFFIPSKKRIAYSEYPFDNIKIQNEKAEFNAETLNLEALRIDTENIWETLKETQKQNKDETKVAKIIAIFRKDKLDLTCMSATLDILKIKFNPITKECLSFKKENLGDMIQIRKTNPSEE